MTLDDQHKAQTVANSCKQKPARRKAHLCLAENCRTIVIGELFCWRHRRPDVWGEYRNVIDELGAR